MMFVKSVLRIPSKVNLNTRRYKDLVDISYTGDGNCLSVTFDPKLTLTGLRQAVEEGC